MDSRDIRNLFEAYTAVYDEELRNEIESDSIDEDLSFIDDLSDNELTQIMEEIFDETGITLDECMNSFGFFLSEAVVTKGGKKARARRAEASTARVTTSSDRRAGRTSERQQKVRIGRLAQAAQRAAEYPGKQARKAAERAKTLAGGAASAVAGGAAEAGRKMQSAKEKIKGFLGKVNRSVRAGLSSVKKEFTGQAAREAQGRVDLRRINRTLRRQARERSGFDTREFEIPRGRYRISGGERTRVGRLQYGPTKTSYDTTSSRREEALKKATRSARGSKGKGVRFAGPKGGGVSQRMISGAGAVVERGKKAKEYARALGLPEEFNFLIAQILEDLIYEGYVEDYDNALYILESLDDYEFDDLIESYLD